VDNDAATYGQAAPSRQPRRSRIRLFDPNGLLAVIAVLFWPLRYFPIVLVPAVFLAGLTAFKHWTDISVDLRRLLGEFSFIVHLLLSLLIINLSARLSMGAVIRAFGGTVREFGLGFFLGFIPRFYVDRSSIGRLHRNGQLWAFGAPLLARLSYFAFGMLAWATYRPDGTWFANLALLVSQVGLWAFLFAAMPLLPGDGYNWLATFFRQPLLRQKALMVLNAKLRGRPLPPRIQPGEVKFLIIFAVTSILVLVVVAFALLTIWGTLLTRNLQGLGALIFLVVVASFAAWLLRFKARVAGRDEQAREVRLLRVAMLGQAHNITPKSSAAPGGRKRRLMIGIAVAATLIGVMFLPSSYDPAGPFKILPLERVEAVAGTDGEVVDVTVREGDWVNAGQVLAHFSSTVQQRDVALTRKNLEDAEARLAQVTANDLKHDAAQAEVERLRSQLDYDEGQLERTAIRAPGAGFVTTPNAQLLTGVWLNAGDNFLRIDNTKVVEAEIEIPQGDISLVKPGDQVRLRPWSESNREIVGRVTAIAAAAADSVDDGITHRRKRLRDGATFQRAATIEQQSISTGPARSRNSGIIREGASAPDRPTRLFGTMTERQPAGAFGDTAGDSGVIRVEASVPNVETGLRSAMSGYAKIRGPEMTVGQAYLRLCMRFLTVELWSWVP